MAPTNPQGAPSNPAPATDAPEEAGLLGLILRERRVLGEEQRQASVSAMGELFQQIDKGNVRLTPDMRPEIERRLSEIDSKIGEQLDQVLHNPEYQGLEATWRGLQGLVQQAGEAGPEVRLRVLNVSKPELLKDLPPGREFDQSALWRKVYEEEFGTFGGDPFGALIGDYEFSRHPQDIELLKKISGVAAASHAPFLAAASPELFGWESYLEEADTPKLEKMFRGPEYLRWKSFRESDDSRYVGLCLPKVLLRLPYGRDTVAVEDFEFEEDVDGRDHSKYLWGNAAYAMGGRLVEAFSDFGWCAAIRGLENGGKVSDLPIHNFRTDAGAIAAKCPTEVALTDRREKELCDLGFIPLTYCKNTDYAVFFGTPSCHKPPKYSTDEANANARLGAQLQYIMATSRVAHYLKAIARDRIGKFTSLEQCHYDLNQWIRGYVTQDETSSDETKARFPFYDARIDVDEVPGKPGCYNATAYLRPHFQLDELTVHLSLVAELPESTRS